MPKISRYRPRSLFAIVAALVALAAAFAPSLSQAAADDSSAISAKKRVLYIDSYHADFVWVRLLTEGILSSFNIKKDADGALDQSASPVQLKVFHMDTKRNPSPEFIQASVTKARQLIDSWKPDVVIASDDNASKYLVAPHYKDSDIPFVFCGLNAEPAEYGYPFSNVTGMTETILMPDLIKILGQHARGMRIGMLAHDRLSERKDEELFERTFDLSIDGVYVETFAEWKQAYLHLQDTADILLLNITSNITGWNLDEAVSFVAQNTRIPSGGWIDWMTPFTLAVVLKSPQEQGAWAAQTALEILGGKPPASIPITANTKAKIFLNMRLAKEMGVTFPIELIERATLVSP